MLGPRVVHVESGSRILAAYPYARLVYRNRLVHYTFLTSNFPIKIQIIDHHPTGSGLIYVPAVSVVSSHFTTKRTSALGIAASGSAIGGMVWPIMFRKLLPSIGFAWMNRVFGFLVLFLAVLSFVLLTDTYSTVRNDRRRRQRTGAPRLQSRHQGQSTANITPATTSERFTGLLTARNSRAYTFLCTGVFFFFLGYWIPLFYVVPFASLSLGTSTTYASYLLSILNAGSFFGRIVPAYLGQLFGSAIVLLFGAAALAALVFVWLTIGTVPGITIWSFLVG